MSDAHPHSTYRYLLWLGLLVVVILIVSAFAVNFPYATQVTTSSAPASFPQNIPAPTPQDHVAAQHGFQYLVSYTAKGFSPATLSVKKGETVRFTNNSASTLKLSLTGAQPQTLAHAAYFEYTFTATGTFTFSDGLAKGTVTVK